jgi:hypothetical protein
LASHHSFITASLALVLAVSGLATAPGATLADSDPVAERAQITYRLDRARQRVQARGSFRFTNRIPVQRVGNRVRRTYLERWGPIAISADATNLRVRPRSVKVQRIPTGGPFDNLVFSFPRIFNGGSVSFTATWNVPGREGASTAGTVVSAPTATSAGPVSPWTAGLSRWWCPVTSRWSTRGAPSVRAGRVASAA